MFLRYRSKCLRAVSEAIFKNRRKGKEFLEHSRGHQRGCDGELRGRKQRSAPVLPPPVKGPALRGRGSLAHRPEEPGTAENSEQGGGTAFRQPGRGSQNSGCLPGLFSGRRPPKWRNHVPLSRAGAALAGPHAARSTGHGTPRDACPRPGRRLSGQPPSPAGGRARELRARRGQSTGAPGRAFPGLPPNPPTVPNGGGHGAGKGSGRGSRPEVPPPRSASALANAGSSRFRRKRPDRRETALSRAGVGPPPSDANAWLPARPVHGPLLGQFSGINAFPGFPSSRVDLASSPLLGQFTFGGEGGRSLQDSLSVCA